MKVNMDAWYLQTKENKNKIKIVYMYVKLIPFAEQLSYLLFQNIGYYNAAVDFWIQNFWAIYVCWRFLFLQKIK